ncbi:MAG: hypothetical protein K9K34_18945 [Desulfarculaceae bacterium]|nr:hypothetical protein [Desulfarculaceae bacterium]
MQQIEKYHNQAMDLAEEAFLAQRRGEQKLSAKLFNEALVLEQKAAEHLKIDQNNEPSRSILYRSAASLAYNASSYDLAERLIAQGLSGFPPPEIKEELKNLYEDVNFLRHLRSQGRILDSSQLLMTLAGNAVRFGGTAADCLMMRVEKISSIFYRTIERLLKYPYRISGGIGKGVKDKYGLYINTFAPASFSVTFQVGFPDPQLPLMPDWEDSPGPKPEDVVDEILDCLEMYEKNNQEMLKERIPDDKYFENFIGLAKQISPDGDNVNLVGFTAIQEGKDRPVALRKSRKQVQAEIKPPEIELPGKERRPFLMSGILMFAASPRSHKFGKVKLMEDSNTKPYEIKVPISLMKDVVQPYYEERVSITGYEEQGKYYLEDITSEDGV